VFATGWQRCTLTRFSLRVPLVASFCLSVVVFVTSLTPALLSSVYILYTLGYTGRGRTASGQLTSHSLNPLIPQEAKQSFNRITKAENNRINSTVKFVIRQHYCLDTDMAIILNTFYNLRRFFIDFRHVKLIWSLLYFDSVVYGCC